MEQKKYFFALEIKGVITPNFVCGLRDNIPMNIEKTKRILEFLENCRYKLPISREEWGGSNIVKLNKDYYDLIGCSSNPSIEILSFEKIDMGYYNHFAVKSLIEIVDDELSSGDRKIIKDIALQSFHKFLEISCDKKSSKRGNLAMCARTDMHLNAINQLLNYGFKLGPPKEKGYFCIY